MNTLVTIRLNGTVYQKSIKLPSSGFFDCVKIGKHVFDVGRIILTEDSDDMLIELRAKETPEEYHYANHNELLNDGFHQA